MRRFIHLDAIAAPLPLDNIDTDKILPGEYLKTVTRTGLGRALFARMRYDADGRELPDFILNRSPWRGAGILIAGENFGCGSSREHAPWALSDYGITCIIATGFADIFHNNCFKNGILPIAVDPAVQRDLLCLAENPATARLRIDLPEQLIRTDDGRDLRFTVDLGGKIALIDGRDEIAQTLHYQREIESWEAASADRFPLPEIKVTHA